MDHPPPYHRPTNHPRRQLKLYAKKSYPGSRGQRLARDHGDRAAGAITGRGAALDEVCRGASDVGGFGDGGAGRRVAGEGGVVGDEDFGGRPVNMGVSPFSRGNKGK